MSITASVYKKVFFLHIRTVLAVVERLFWQLETHFSGRCRCREVAVVERFKQELMYGLSAGTKKCGRCREVAVVERWPLVEVRLYVLLITSEQRHHFSTEMKPDSLGKRHYF